MTVIGLYNENVKLQITHLDTITTLKALIFRIYPEADFI